MDGVQVGLEGEAIKVVQGINHGRHIPDSDPGSYFRRIRHLGFRCDTSYALRLKVSCEGLSGCKSCPIVPIFLLGAVPAAAWKKNLCAQNSKCVSSAWT